MGVMQNIGLSWYAAHAHILSVSGPDEYSSLCPYATKGGCESHPGKTGFSNEFYVYSLTK